MGYWTTASPEDIQKIDTWEALLERRTSEYSRDENGRVTEGKIDKVTAVNGTQPSSGQNSGLMTLVCRYVFVQQSRTGDSALDCR